MLMAVRAAQRCLFQLNLFESDSLDEETLHNERQSSRIYVALFIIILAILSVYTGVGSQTSSVIIINPSFSTFETLQQKYPKTLYCPCSNTAVQYSTFVQAHTTFHQVGTFTTAFRVRQNTYKNHREFDVAAGRGEGAGGRLLLFMQSRRNRDRCTL